MPVERGGMLFIVRAYAIAVLVAGLASPLFDAVQFHSPAGGRTGKSVKENSSRKNESFRSERFGVTLEYKAGWKLAALPPFAPPGAPSESIPVAAAYRLIPPTPPGIAGGTPYSYQYYVFFVRRGFVPAAHALGFNRNTQGEWIYNDAGILNKAVQTSGNGWQGLRMTYDFRLYNAPSAEERAQGLDLGSGYLGMSEGEKDLVSAGGNLSLVLEFDPDIETDAVRDGILKSLRFLESPTQGPQTK